MQPMDFFKCKIAEKLKSNVLAEVYRAHYLFLNLYFSHLAYFTNDFVKSELIALGASRVNFYNNDGTQAFLAVFDSFAIVSFRGTELHKSADVKTILKFWKRRFGVASAHAGFVESFHDVDKLIMEDLRKLPDDVELHYTGHSMGGALATMLALMYKPKKICTFGSPKVGGGSRFINSFTGVNYCRVHVKWDFVQMLPFNIIPFLRYNHLGTELVLPGPKNPFKAHKLISYIKGIIAIEHI